MKMRMLQLWQGLLLMGVLAGTLPAARPPQSADEQQKNAASSDAAAKEQPPAQAPAEGAQTTPATMPVPADKAPAPVVAQPATKAATPETIINLSASGSDTVELGVQVSGDFAAPFTYVATPNFANGVSMSLRGVISGTPTKPDEQHVMIAVTDHSGKAVAQYAVELQVGSPPVVMLGASPSSKPAAANSAPAKPTIATNSIYKGGDTISGSVIPSKQNANAKQSADDQSSGAQQNPQQTPGQPPANGTANPCSVANTPVTLTRGAYPPVTALVDSSCNFSYQFSFPFNLNEDFMVSTGSGADSLSVPLTVQPRIRIGGEDQYAIVGYQQAGASSSDFTQNVFFDFYRSNPLHTFPIWLPIYGKKTVSPRWWFNVRIASFPQSGNQTVAQAATAGVAGTIGTLKLNQLAEGAELLGGLEFPLWTTSPLRGFSENTLQTFRFAITAAYGATGFFSSSSPALYQVPDPSSPQYPVFQSFYPNVTTKYVGFAQPDTQRFPKQYLAGVRLTTRYFDPTGTPLITPPAMVSVTVGQNQVVTGGISRGVVGRFEAFYPLPFGNRGTGKFSSLSGLYLFGTAQMRLGGRYMLPHPLVLAPAPTNPMVNAYDSDVTLINNISNRDVYRIGVGVDLVKVISQLTGNSGQNSSGNATGKKATSTSTGNPPPPLDNAPAP